MVSLRRRCSGPEFSSTNIATSNGPRVRVPGTAVAYFAHGVDVKKGSVLRPWGRWEKETGFSKFSEGPRGGGVVVICVCHHKSFYRRLSCFAFSFASTASNPTLTLATWIVLPCGQNRSRKYYWIGLIISEDTYVTNLLSFVFVLKYNQPNANHTV